MTNRFENGPALSRRTLLSAAGALSLLPLLGSPALAQTLSSIKQAGVLKVGAQVAQVPWGFTDATGQLTGFDIELVRMLGAELGVKVEFTPVTPANRTAALLTGQVDMLAAVMGIFADRQKVVLFSRPYCNNDNIFIGRAEASVKGWGYMNGLRVGVPRGTPQDIAVTKAAPQGATIQRFDDDATTVQALISGQVDMIGAAATQIPNIAQVAGPGKFVQKFVLGRAFNGFAVRPNAREWATVLSAFVTKKLESGELKALYKKWIGEELAPLPDTGEGAAALPIVVTPS
jgi:polar amino acid transport system substrate-binding protein